jgi:hypothetical protein
VCTCHLVVSLLASSQHKCTDTQHPLLCFFLYDGANALCLHMTLVLWGLRGTWPVA